MTALATAPDRPTSALKRLACPKPGVYTNIPFETYAAWDALNHSTLKHLAKSPMHLKCAMEEPPEAPSAAMQFGTIFHALFLEPKKAAALMVPAPINEKTGNPFGRDTKAWAEYAVRHPGKLIVSQDEVAGFHTMAKNAAADPDIVDLMRSEGQSEVCLVWDDPMVGGRCKARVDRLLAKGAHKTIGRVDYKTAESGRIGKFRKACEDYGYFTANSFYARGCRALDLFKPGAFLVFESARPFPCVLYTVGEETSKVANDIVVGWMQTYRACRESGRYPGYSNQTLDASDWWFKQFANSLED